MKKHCVEKYNVAAPNRFAYSAPARGGEEFRQKLVLPRIGAAKGA